MSKTMDDLQEAFAGESQANRRYLAFAKVAEDEGMTQVAKLFKAAAEAETIHAMAHLKAMDGVGDTRKNLEEAVKGETYEFTKMYPVFITDAEAEGNQKALRMFRWANAVEEIHAGLYEKYKQAVDSGQVPESKPIHVCSVCGNTVEGEVPDRCPICSALAKSFKEIV